MCYVQIAFCACGAQLGAQQRRCTDQWGLGTFTHTWILAAYFVDIAARLCETCLAKQHEKTDLSIFVTQCLSRTAQACGCESITQAPELPTRRWELPGYELVLVAVKRALDNCGKLGCVGNPIRQNDTLIDALQKTVEHISMDQKWQSTARRGLLGLVLKE